MSHITDLSNALRDGRVLQRLRGPVAAATERILGGPLDEAINATPSPARLRAWRKLDGVVAPIAAAMKADAETGKKVLADELRSGLGEDLDEFYRTEALAQGQLIDDAAYRALRERLTRETTQVKSPARVWQRSIDHASTLRESARRARSGEVSLQRAIAESWSSKRMQLGAALAAIGGVWLTIALQPRRPWDDWSQPLLGGPDEIWTQIVLMVVLLVGPIILGTGFGFFCIAAPLFRGTRITAARQRFVTRLGDWKAAYVSAAEDAAYRDLAAWLPREIDERIDDRHRNAERYQDIYLSPEALSRMMTAIRQTALYQGYSPDEPRVGARSILNTGEWDSLAERITPGGIGAKLLPTFARATAADRRLAQAVTHEPAEAIRETLREWLKLQIKANPIIAGDDTRPGGMASVFVEGVPAERAAQRVLQLEQLSAPQLRLRPAAPTENAAIVLLPKGDAARGGPFKPLAAALTQELNESDSSDRVDALQISSYGYDAAQLVNTVDDVSRLLQKEPERILRELPSPQAVYLAERTGIIRMLFAPPCSASSSPPRIEQVPDDRSSSGEPRSIENGTIKIG